MEFNDLEELQPYPPMTDIYVSPFTKRYVSSEMTSNFSDKKRYSTWRKLWFHLAKAQQKLGEKITDKQLSELEKNINNIDFKQVNALERVIKHDVMAHLKAYCQCCPTAEPIIHLGATSCFVTDNSDLILIREAFNILIPKILKCISILSKFCENYRDMPTLAYTHFQPAQLTTVGKRGTLWLNDLISDFNSILECRDTLKFRGCKGTIGTQASYLILFDGDHSKVEELDRMVAEMNGFDSCVDVCGQTYSRKVDLKNLLCLSSYGSTVHKICTDIRLLSGLQELGEPFDSEQVGSSAMPFKRNPVRSERCCGLARHLMTLSNDGLHTYSVQWLERTLDDSSNRRLFIPESFLTADAMTGTFMNILDGLVVYPLIIQRNVRHELPIICVEKILIVMVQKGASRQECHEKLRIVSRNAIEKTKLDGSDNHFLDSLLKDPYFDPIKQELNTIIEPRNFVGRSPEQVDKFLKMVVNPILENHKNILPQTVSRYLI